MICNKSPWMCLFKLIVVVVLVYGLWMHNWQWIIAAVVIAIVGLLIKIAIKKPAEIAKPARKKRR